jgi:aspartate racemase
MKTLGLIGGFSWVSTIDYYREINKGINEKLGDNNSARCIIHSLNYQDIIDNNSKGNLEGTYQLMLDASIKLKNAGADGIMLCANTMHLFADRLEEAVKLPYIHIVKATAREISRKDLKKIGLLGTKFTMEMDFYKNILVEHGIETIVPELADRNFIHETIFAELGKNILSQETKARYLEINNKLLGNGAQGVILGCTEIPLIIQQSDCSAPVFDTTVIHSKAAVEFALG